MVMINALSAQKGGGKVYLQQLLAHIPPEYKQSVLLITKKNNRDFWESFGIQVIASRWASRSIVHQVLFEIFYLPGLIKKCGIRVYFAPSGIVPSWRCSRYKAVVTFQNMLPFSPQERKRYPWGYMRLRLFLLKYILARSFRRADRIIFISRYARDVVSACVPSIWEKSVVIAHGIDGSFRNAGQKSGLPIPGIESGYVLYVSLIDVYKAHCELVYAWNLLKKMRPATHEKLLFIGSTAMAHGKKVRQQIRVLNLEDEVFLLGEIPNEQLPVYYHNAAINIFASSCENCPNIVLEMLAAGRALLCSKYEPMPEFGQDAALYFDPYSPDEIARLLSVYLTDDQLRIEMGRKALIQSRKFDWKKSAEETWKNIFRLHRSNE